MREAGAEPSLEKPIAGALAASALANGESDEQSKTGTTGEDTPKSPGSAETIRARAKLAKAHFENGLKYRRGGDSGRALVDFLKATREDPKLVEAYYEQALIFREKGFHKLAVSRLEQALAIRGQYQKARLLLATIKLEQGNVSDAVEQLGASLGLPKTSTAMKPDASDEHDNKMLGIPPMILQSVHTAMPVAKRNEQNKVRTKQNQSEQNRSAEIAEQNPNLDQDEQPTFEEESPKARVTKPAVRRKKPGSRRKVRELMARKYGKNNGAKKHQRMSWIAKIFSWPEPFKFEPSSAKNEKIAVDDPTDDELQPRGESNLVAEFRTEEKEKPAVADTDADDEYTPRFPKTKKTLLAYNGDPVDTIDLVAEKIPDRKPPETKPKSAPKVQYQAEETSTPKKDSSWSLEKITSSKDETKVSDSLENEHKPSETKSSPVKSKVASRRPTDDDDSESGGKTFALSARQVKIASKGFLDFEPAAAHEPAKKVERKIVSKPPAAPVEDEWTRRLRYLAENGTSSLKAGEAFMFSEDTGEAVLFTNGQRIRRVIADAQETQEVLKLRRPDVLVPKELFYNTALLGKVVASPPPPAPPTQLRLPEGPTTEKPSLEPPGFKIEQMMDNPTGFWNWFKGLVNL